MKTIFNLSNGHVIQALKTYFDRMGLDGQCFASCFLFLLVSSLVFLIWPQLDIWVSTYFYHADGYFPANQNAFVMLIYEGIPWLGRITFLFAMLITLIAIVRPSKISRRHWRRASAFSLVVILGIGFLVHAVLKDAMGRPRPRDVQVFAGPTHFVPVFTASNFCSTNCSFVSGHAALGFSLISLGMLGVRKRRHFWFVVGATTGTFVGLVRIAQGGHFLSDVVFAFIAIWFVHLLIRTCWFRFRAWQIFCKENRSSRVNQNS